MANHNIDTHCQDCQTLLGRSYRHVHEWIDFWAYYLRRGHRLYRHNIITTPQEALEKFGEGADLATIIHILRDGSDHLCGNVSPKDIKNWETIQKHIPPHEDEWHVLYNFLLEVHSCREAKYDALATAYKEVKIHGKERL